MRKSLITSLVLHGGVLVAALIVLPNPDKFKVQPQDAIQVDISKLADESKRKATTKSAEKPVERVAPKKAEVVKKVEPAPKVAEEVKKAVKEAVAEPPPPAPKVEEPKKEEPKPLDPDPLKDLLKKVEEEPKAEVKKAEVKPVKKPEEKKKKKKPELNTDDIAAFLNKTDDEKTAPQQTAKVTAQPEQGVADILGTDDALAATLVDALRQKLAGCWSVPPGAREANITVKVRFFLNPDGSVAGLPEVLNGSADPLFATTAQSAVSAVMECKPYDFFPPDRYDLWKDNTVNFNPNMMFGT